MRKDLGKLRTCLNETLRYLRLLTFFCILHLKRYSLDLVDSVLEKPLTSTCEKRVTERHKTIRFRTRKNNITLR